MSYTPRRTKQITGSISSSANLSGAYDLEDYKILSVIVASTDWKSADIGMQCSDESTGTYYPLYDQAGARVKIAGVSTSEAHVYTFDDDPLAVAGFSFVKLQSISTSEPADSINQAKAITINILAK